LMTLGLKIAKTVSPENVFVIQQLNLLTKKRVTEYVTRQISLFVTASSGMSVK
jgi:uncharacterized protein YjiK